MKNRKKALFLLSSVFLICNGLLHSREGHKEDPHYVCFEGDEVAVEEDGIYADSNKGMFKRVSTKSVHRADIRRNISLIPVI